jgi:hypothetical protein
MNSDFGFFIIRHVSQKEHNLYWQECYKTIRKLYQNKIFIIDDNSNQELLTNIELKNTQIINSEFKGRGEMLPYYYFYKIKPFNKAIIIHDSMFIGQKLDITTPNKVKFNWFIYSHRWNNKEKEIELLKKLEKSDFLIKNYNNKKSWFPCYGVSSIIELDFLEKLQYKYNIFNLLNYVYNRNDRMCIERIFGLIFFIEAGLKRKTCSYLGKIHNFPRKTFKSNAYNFNDYLKDKKDFFPIIKIWIGR